MLKIVPMYQGMAAFAAAARGKPAADRSLLWQQLVIDPYWQDWAAGQFNEQRVREQLSRPYSDLEGLEAETAELCASGIETIVAAAYERIGSLLPYHEEDSAVCILAADPQDHGLVENLQGVVGSCVGGNTLLTVNPAGTGWREMVPYVLAHERHHSAWGYHHYVLNADVEPNFLASLVNEGLADSFASRLFSQVKPRWINALSPAELRVQWQAVRPFLTDPDPAGELYRRFFFGDASTPPFSAYTIGFRMVQSYLSRHPQEDLASWILRRPQEILAGSVFDA